VRDEQGGPATGPLDFNALRLADDDLGVAALDRRLSAKGSLMKVALYHHSRNDADAGASRVYHLLAAGLQERGHDVRVRHLEDLRPPRNPRRRLAVERLAMPQLLSWRAWYDRQPDDDIVMSSSGMAYPLFRRMRASPGPRPTLVNHLHGVAAYDYSTTTAESLLGHRPTSLAYRTVTGPFTSRWDRRGVLAADLTVVQNRRDLGHVRSFATNPAAVELVYPSVHPEILRAGYEPLGQAREAGSILWFGTWDARKGAAYVPAAFRQLRSVHPGARLYIGGTGLSPEAVKGFFPPEDRPSVHHVARISRRDHIDLMRRLSIVLFPSLSEGFGLALPEAMAMGLAAVTTNTGFGGDHLVDGINARIVPASSVHLAEALTALLDDDGLTARIAGNGQAVARSFTVDRMVDDYERIFIDSRRRAAEPRLLYGANSRDHRTDTAS